MPTLKIALAIPLLTLIYACSHPIGIVGKGDITSNFGRSCTLEDSLMATVPDNCAKNYVVNDYFDTYTATPRTGWKFDHWENYCTTAVDNTCTFNIPAATVIQAWFRTVPPLVAVFTPIGGVDCSTILPGSSFKDKMLCAHNARRGTFPTPTPVPPIPDLEWDQDLADIAAGYAAKCQWGHNENPGETYPGGGYVGENIALFSFGYEVSNLPTTTLQGWVEGEMSQYNYASNSCTAGQCGHYTQVIWRNTSRVGCAIQQCADFANVDPWANNGYMLVCNYWPGGNFNGEWPY